MASLGNAWHIPGSAEPYRRAGMRDPVGAVVPGSAIEIFVGNQFQGDAGVPVDVAGTALHFRYRRDNVWSRWQHTPVEFVSSGKANGGCDTTGNCRSVTKDHAVCVAGDPGRPKTVDSEYCVAKIAANVLHAGDVVEYCIAVRYQGVKHEKTWVVADGDGSRT